jgi:PST family polysaccharide transporter
MSDVGRRTFRAAAWGFAGAMGKRVLTLAGVMLLARVLPPRDFGLLGFAMVYLTFVEVIGDFGAGAALVYWPTRREDAAQTSFIVNVIAGVFWTLVSFALAPYIARFFHEPAGTLVLRALCITTLIKCLGNTHDALAQKDLRFRERSIPELALTGIKAVVSLVFALLGYGVWSLVFGQVAGIVSWTLLLWVVVPWRPTWSVPADLFTPMLRYGGSIVAVQVLGAFMFYLDSVAVGRYLGAHALGLYQMASRIPDSSIMVIIWVAAQALFPAFSALHAEGGDVKGAYLVATRCVASLTLPSSLGLFFLARPIILVFFGPAWVAAAPILSMLALYVGFRGLDEVGNVLKATGRIKVLVWLFVVKAIALVPAVFFAARISAAAVAGALTVVYGIGALLTTFVAARVIGIHFGAIGAAFSRSAMAVAVMSLVLFAWMRWTPSLVPIAQLAGGLAIGGGVYLVALRLIDPEIFGWMRNIALRREVQTR